MAHLYEEDYAHDDVNRGHDGYVLGKEQVDDNGDGVHHNGITTSYGVDVFIADVKLHNVVAQREKQQGDGVHDVNVRMGQPQYAKQGQCCGRSFVDERLDGQKQQVKDKQITQKPELVHQWIGRCSFELPYKDINKVDNAKITHNVLRIGEVRFGKRNVLSNEKEHER